MKTPLLLAIALLCAFAQSARAQKLVSPVPCPQFFSPAGLPLAGGFLFTYAAGTLAQQPTFTDSTGATQNTNPIVLNAGGFPASSTGSCGLWLDPSLAYKFVLQNASGSIIWTVDNVTASNVASLLSQPNTWTALQTFVGGVLIPGGSTFTSISAPLINNVTFIDGNTYAKTAAGINLADTTLGSSAGAIVVNYPGNYCDATVTVSNGHTLQFGPGTYILNIAGADSISNPVTWSVTGAGQQQTILQSCAASNKDVITSQNFSVLHGGTNGFGVFRPVISNMRIDGNSSTEVAGFGVRLYGRAPLIHNVIFSNIFQDAIYLEFGNAGVDASDATDVEGQVNSVKITGAGGNGITNNGGIRELHEIVIYSTTGWGVQTLKPLESFTNANIFTGDDNHGALDIGAGGAVATGSSLNLFGGGWGVKVEGSDAGPAALQGVFGACTTCGPNSFAIDINSQNVTIQGTIENSGIGLELRSVLTTFMGNFLNNTTNIDFTNDLGENMILAEVSLSGGALSSGTYKQSDFLQITFGGTSNGTLTHFPGLGAGVSGWDAPVLNSAGPVTTPAVVWCGNTAVCSQSTSGNVFIQAGTVALSGGGVGVVALFPYTSTSTFSCVTTDLTTAANPSKAVAASTSSITVTGTGTDVISWHCVGK